MNEPIPLEILGRFCPEHQRDQLAAEWLDARTAELRRDAEFDEVCEQLEKQQSKAAAGLLPREGTKMRLVLDSINGHPVSSGDFINTLPDIPRHSVAAYLCQLAQDGHLRKVKTGVYERVTIKQQQ